MRMQTATHQLFRNSQFILTVQVELICLYVGSVCVCRLLRFTTCIVSAIRAAIVGFLQICIASKRRAKMIRNRNKAQMLAISLEPSANLAPANYLTTAQAAPQQHCTGQFRARRVLNHRRTRLAASRNCAASPLHAILELGLPLFTLKRTQTQTKQRRFIRVQLLCLVFFYLE